MRWETAESLGYLSGGRRFSLPSRLTVVLRTYYFAVPSSVARDGAVLKRTSYWHGSATCSTHYGLLCSKTPSPPLESVGVGLDQSPQTPFLKPFDS